MGRIMTILLLAAAYPVGAAASEAGELENVIRSVSTEGEFVIGTDIPEDPEDTPDEDDQTEDCLHFIALNSAGDSSDAVLVESNGRYGLIDASHPSGETAPNRYPEYTGKGAGGQTVVEYLCGLAGINHLDFVIGTHSHSDHIGGIPDIAAAGLVDQNTIYIYKTYECEEKNNWHNRYYADLALNAMRSCGAQTLDLTDPDEDDLAALQAIYDIDWTDSCGDHISFPFGDFIIRLYNMHTESFEYENLNSIITTLHKDDKSAVLMADMEMTDGMEDRIVSAIIREEGTDRTDVYKLAHHGYKTSNGVAALSAMNPRYGIVSTNRMAKDPISSAYYNYILSKTGAEIYRTSEADAGIVADFRDKVNISKMTYDGMLDAAVPWITMYESE